MPPRGAAAARASHLRHFVDEKQGQGHVPYVVPEAQLEYVTVRQDYRMSRRHVADRAARRVIGDEVEDDVSLGEVRVPRHVEVAGHQRADLPRRSTQRLVTLHTTNNRRR